MDYILELHEMIRAPHVLACPIGRRSAQTHQKWSSFSIFSRFSPLYHVFGQVTYVQTAQIIVLHEGVCPIVFILLHQQSWQGGCSKL